jgi:hypothetical protein
MGIACTMSRILQQSCTPPVEDPVPDPLSPCTFLHPDAADHDMTWIMDEPPTGWVAPFTVDWGDGTIETSFDGEEAHEYALSGTYAIAVRDSGAPIRRCALTITVPHAGP